MSKIKQFFQDLKQATFKQWMLMSFPYLIVGLPGLIIFETWHYYCIRLCVEHCNVCSIPAVLRWIFLGIALFPMLRNLIFGAIPNLFKK